MSTTKQTHIPPEIGLIQATLNSAAVHLEHGHPECASDCWESARRLTQIAEERAELLEALRGCAEMLAECAKQHRLDGSGQGHGTMADKHAAIARTAIAKATQ